MFRSASQIDSERTASSLRRIKANWERTADNWFTGSVDSIDRRIALCERLIHQASQATGRLLDRPEAAHYMKLASDLRADHEALTQMRRDLLTAAVDRDPDDDPGLLPPYDSNPDLPKMRLYKGGTNDIVGYTYNGENFLPEELIEHMVAQGELPRSTRPENLEQALDEHAKRNRIDRYDEDTYDSSEHPKVIFDYMDHPWRSGRDYFNAH